MKTTDICDHHIDEIQIAEPIGFKSYGGRREFSGEIETVKCYEDNTFVRAALEKNGQGKVLVIDGGGSTRCALLGDNIAELAQQSQWNGVASRFPACSLHREQLKRNQVLRWNGGARPIFPAMTTPFRDRVINQLPIQVFDRGTYGTGTRLRRLKLQQRMLRRFQVCGFDLFTNGAEPATKLSHSLRLQQVRDFPRPVL